MGRFRTNVLNAERLAERLRDQPFQVTDALVPVIALAGQKVANHAIEGINSPPKTGRVYTQRFARGPNGGLFAYGSRPPHQASAPGEYPAADTGNLARTIFADQQEDVAASAETLEEIVANVYAEAEYAAPLEFKPEERGGRPFLRRAAGELTDEIHDDVANAARGALGPDGGGGGAPPAPGSSPPRGPAPRPPAPSSAPASNEGASGFSADDLNRAESDRLRNLPAPGEDGGP